MNRNSSGFLKLILSLPIFVIFAFPLHGVADPEPLDLSISPETATIYVGSQQTISAQATGGVPPYTFQFYKIIQGSSPLLLQQGNSSTYTIQPAATDARTSPTYRAYVADSLHSTAQAEGQYTIVGPPEITTQPQSITVEEHETITFSVEALASGIPQYKWFLNGVEVNAVTGSSYSVANVTTAMNGHQVKVEIRDITYGLTTESATATLTVQGDQSAPVFKREPTSITAREGKRITLRGIAQREPGKPIFYQWYKNGVALQDETSTTLKLGKLSTDGVGDYYVVASKTSGVSTQSSVASIALEPLNATVSVAFRARMKKAKRQGAVQRGSCRVKRITPKWAKKILLKGGSYRYTVGNVEVATIQGKAGRKYRLTLEAAHNGQEFACTFIDSRGSEHGASGIALKVRQ